MPEELLNGDLIGRLDDLESRVDDLEQQCKKINSDIAALQAIVNAVQTRDYITAVEPVVENGVEVGCRIVFANANPIVIYHGKDGTDGTDGKDGEDGKDGADGENGQDGVAPVIGIAQDSDSVWYWTLNGNWLLDDAGNKIKAVGVDGADGNDGTDGLDGKDGVTPTLQITEGYWEISYDNGVTWTRLGKAVGEDGKDGQDGVGNCIISKVYEDNGYVVFLLSTGEEYKVPFSANSLDIIFSVEPGFGLMPGKTTVIDYTIVGGDENTLVRLIPGEILECVVKAKSNTEGSIYIKVWPHDEDAWDRIIDPDVYGDATYGDMMEPMYALLVSVSDGKGNTVLKSLNFAHGVLESICDAYLVDATAGLITTTVKANTSYDEVVYDASWLSFVETKAMREDKLTFAYEANDSDRYRSTIVYLKNTLGQTLESFAIAQRTAALSGNIEFADLKVKDICVQRYDKDGDGELSYDEAALVTDVNGLFDDVFESIKSFDEFQFFISVNKLPDEFFLDCTALESTILPNNLDSLGRGVFANCTALKSITIPEGVTSILDYCFTDCTSLKEINLPEILNEIGSYAFYHCSSLESITIPEGVTSLPYACFRGCTSLKEINLPETLDIIGEYAFENCSSLESITIPEGVKIIDEQFYSCVSLKRVYLPKSIVELNGRTFWDCENVSFVLRATTPPLIRELENYMIYVPNEAISVYRELYPDCSFRPISIMENITESWDIMGSMTNWERTVSFIASGDKYVIKELKLSASDEFVIRGGNETVLYNSSYSLGENGSSLTLGESGSYIQVADDGLYDLEFDPLSKTISFKRVVAQIAAWAELPLVNDYDRNGRDDSDASLYYAYHFTDLKAPDGSKARNYTVCFSGEHHCPVWVSAPRHNMYQVKKVNRTDAYKADPDIPYDIQYHSKSTGGGCNKGHMLGSAERLASRTTNEQVFYYSNIAPQLSAGFNTGGGGWNILEDYIDTQVCPDTLYVVIGCYFDTYTDGYGKKASPKRIEFGGRSDVSFPTMFYYALLRTKSGSSHKAVKDCKADELQCVAFVRSHTNELKGQEVSSKEMMSIADLEKITGFTYFVNVPQAPKKSYKASDWDL